MQLDPMSQPEFDEYLSTAVDEYVRDTARASARPVQDVEERARKDYAELLPDGLSSANQHLFSARIEPAAAPVGMVWIGISERPSGRSAYIYDIRIRENSRGRGFGRRLLEAVEAKSVDLGASRIGLNVFGYNTVARALYESAGFQVGAVGMFKLLDATATAQERSASAGD